MEYCNENNYLVFVTNTTKRTTHSRSFLTQILNLTNETNQANNTQNECEIIVENFSYDGCLEDVPTPTTTQTLSESLTMPHTTEVTEELCFSYSTHFIITSSTMATTVMATTPPANAPSITLISMEQLLTSTLYTAYPSPVQTPIASPETIINAFVGDSLTNEEFVLESERHVMDIVSTFTLFMVL